jgi:hypothetical protein
MHLPWPKVQSFHKLMNKELSKGKPTYTNQGKKDPPP